MRRSKEKTQLVYVGSKDKILKDLESRKEQIQETAREQTERWINRPQSDFEKMLHKQSRDIQEAASEMGMDSLSVAWAHDPFKDFQTVTIAPMDFCSILTDEQIKTLLPVVNDLVFVEAQSLEDIVKLFECKHTNPLKVKSNALVSYLFGELSRNKWICQNWQKVAEENKCFAGKRGNILTQKTLSNAPTKYCRAREIQTDGILNEAIYDAVNGLKR